jgi:hypothetical protein
MQFKNEKCIVLNIEIKKNIEINKIENLKLNLKKKKNALVNEKILF